MQNEIKGMMARMLAQRGAMQYGIVSAVDPKNHAVKVRKQPSNTETTWMPVGSMACGSVRVSRPPDINEHVFIVPVEDNPEICVAVSAVFDTQVMPPVSPLTGVPAMAGEIFIQTGCDQPPPLGQNTGGDGTSPQFSTPWLHMTKNSIAFGVGNTRLTMDASGIYINGAMVDVENVLRVGTGYTGTIPDGSGGLVDVSEGIITGSST